MVLLLVRKKKHHFESIDSISPLVSKRISKRLEKKKIRSNYHSTKPRERDGSIGCKIVYNRPNDNIGMFS